MDAALCNVYTIAKSFLTTILILGALASVLWAGVAYTLSGILPEVSQRARSSFKDVLLGILIFVIGPIIILALASELGLSSSCGAVGGTIGRVFTTLGHIVF